MKKQILLISGILFSLIFITFVLANTQAVCKPEGAASITFLSGQNFGIGKPLTNISIEASSTLGNVSEIRAVLSIFKTNNDGSKGAITTVTPKTVQTDKTGKVITSIDTTKINTASGNYILQVDLPTINVTLTKPFSYMKTLKVTLSCKCDAGSCAVSRPVNCKWYTEDADNINLVNPVLINAEPKFTIIQYIKTGDIEIDSSTVDLSTRTLTFNALDETGTAKVTIVVSRTDYISDTDTYSIEIGTLDRIQKLYIDNIPYSDIGSKLSTGTHVLKFNVLESGVAVDIASIDAKISTPTGGSSVVTFVKNGNDWSATTDIMQTPGQTYILSGTINFVDYLNKEPRDFESPLTTTASGVVDRTTFDWMIIVYIVIGIVVIGGILFAFGAVFRRKKK